MPEKRIRVLIAKQASTVTTGAQKNYARALRDAGMEVIYPDCGRRRK